MKKYSLKRKSKLIQTVVLVMLENIITRIITNKIKAEIFNKAM
jgi:hypothetical protein